MFEVRLDESMAVQFADFCHCTKNCKNVSEIGLSHYKPSHQIGSISVYGSIAVSVDSANWFKGKDLTHYPQRLLNNCHLISSIEYRRGDT